MTDDEQVNDIEADATFALYLTRQIAADLDHGRDPGLAACVERLASVVYRIAVILAERHGGP